MAVLASPVIGSSVSDLVLLILKQNEALEEKIGELEKNDKELKKRLDEMSTKMRKELEEKDR